jgi:hypothetical protein
VNQAPPHLERLDNPGPLRAPRLTAVSAVLVVIGLIGLGVTYAIEPGRAWGALLQGALIPTWISLGALFFIAINSIGGAHWTVPIRRVMEGLSAGVWLTLVGFALLVVGLPYLYEWANDAAHRQELFHAHDNEKNAWMTPNRVMATSALIVAAWIFFRSNLVRLSLRQDERLDTTASHQRWSIVFLLVFALSFTLFVWDWVLSLQVHFASTAWGLYCFVGSLQTFLAVLCIVAWWLQRGPLKDVIRPHIAKDLGTWMVAWSCIWAYIAYVHYVIIYFANMNEESYFYLMRMQHGYGCCYVLEVVLRFPLPFLLLLSQRVRNDLRALAIVSVLVLLGSWIDLWWMVMPALSPNAFHGFWALPELAVGAGFVGGLLLLATRFWGRHGLIPQGDPRLLSAINAEHLH